VITVGGYQVKTITLHLPWAGCWSARIEYEAKVLSGIVAIDWRGWQLIGTVDPTRTGAFAGEPVATIVGGYPWLNPLPSKAYTSDRGLTARELASTLASSLAQPLVVDGVADRPLGRYFATRNESGGATLSRLFGRRSWYVDTTQTTRVGPRQTPAIGKSVSVLQYDAREGRAELYADRPDDAPVGALLPKDAHLSASLRITSLWATVTSDKERLVAYVEPVNA
jgi:hypothetical protein